MAAPANGARGLHAMGRNAHAAQAFRCASGRLPRLAQAIGKLLKSLNAQALPRCPAQVCPGSRKLLIFLVPRLCPGFAPVPPLYPPYAGAPFKRCARVLVWRDNDTWARSSRNRPCLSASAFRRHLSLRLSIGGFIKPSKVDLVKGASDGPSLCQQTRRPAFSILPPRRGNCLAPRNVRAPGRAAV